MEPETTFQDQIINVPIRIKRRVPQQSKEPVAPPEHTHSTSGVGLAEQTIHPEIYHYFNMVVGEGTRDHLKTISDWAMESGDVGKALKKIRALEDSLGEPSVGETRMSKLYNWIRMSNNIRNLEGEMRGELAKINGKLNSELTALKENHKAKIDRINSEIKAVQHEYNKAVKDFKLNATNRAKQMSEAYAQQIRELKDMRSAFKGVK